MVNIPRCTKVEERNPADWNITHLRGQRLTKDSKFKQQSSYQKVQSLNERQSLVLVPAFFISLWELERR